MELVKYCGIVCSPIKSLMDHLWKELGVEYKCTQCGHKSLLREETPGAFAFVLQTRYGEHTPRGKKPCQL